MENIKFIVFTWKAIRNVDVYIDIVSHKYNKQMFI